MTTEARKPPSMDQKVDGRLAQVEIRQAKLETTLESVVSEVSKIGTAVVKLDHHIMAMGRPNWQNWISAGALMATVTIGFAGIFVRPIQIQLQYTEKATEQNRTSLIKSGDEIDRLYDRISRMEERVSLARERSIHGHHPQTD